MDERPVSRWMIWKNRGLRAGRWALRAVPFLAGMLAALAGLALYNTLRPPAASLTTRDVKKAVNEVLASATPQPPWSEQVYQIIQPSLVLIQTREGTQNSQADYGLGSGVVIDLNGDILTSLHVIQDATEIMLTFSDGSQSPARVVARQPEKDIAVVQAVTPPKLLAPAVIGNPAAMRVGDEAYAVGNPFGLYSSMSAGVISGFDRTFQARGSPVELTGMIQIDAAVNPGNSGGPLLNRYGQVIGIVTGILNPTDQNFFVGIGFAVPIPAALSALGQPPPY